MISNTTVSYRELQDDELVQLIAKNNDNRACSVLMQRYNDSLCYELRKMVYDKSDAEYLAIQGFAKAFINIHQYIPEFAFSTWLFNIAKNNCIDFLRGKKRRNNTISINNIYTNENGGEIKMELRSNDLSPEEQLIKKQRAGLLYKAISKLDPPYRSIIKLHYFEELSLKEVSERLDVPISRVKVNLFRARNQLYKLYDLT